MQEQRTWACFETRGWEEQHHYPYYCSRLVVETVLCSAGLIGCLAGWLAHSG